MTYTREDFERDLDRAASKVAGDRLLAVFDRMRRLEGVIKSAESARTERKRGVPCCPWCDGMGEHDLTCAAFTPEGEVR